MRLTEQELREFAEARTLAYFEGRRAVPEGERQRLQLERLERVSRHMERIERVLRPMERMGRGRKSRALVCNTCDRSFRGLRAGDDCPGEGCTGAVYFDVSGKGVAHV